MEFELQVVDFVVVVVFEVDGLQLVVLEAFVAEVTDPGESLPWMMVCRCFSWCPLPSVPIRRDIAKVKMTSPSECLKG